jgi:hypothetical protein
LNALDDEVRDLERRLRESGAPDEILAWQRKLQADVSAAAGTDLVKALTIVHDRLGDLLAALRGNPEAMARVGFTGGRKEAKDAGEEER